jgi:hypothetical protein
MMIAPTLAMMLIMVGAAFAYVMLTRKQRKKPDIKNQTIKRCPYSDCNWWIIFKDLNNEVRQLYRSHYLEMHKTAPRPRLEDIGGNWLLRNQLQLLEKSVATGSKRDHNSR